MDPHTPNMKLLQRSMNRSCIQCFTLLFLVGCGGANTTGDSSDDSSAGDEHADETGADESPEEPSSDDAASTACGHSYTSILALVQRSQQSACDDDTACATVMHPGHPSPERLLVVHSDDAEELDALSRGHLERCGARLHHEDLEEAFDVASAVCREHRCTNEITTFHPEALE